MNERIEIGNYTACHCKSLASGKEWWRVYIKDARDGLSDHPTAGEAKKAIKRYQQRSETSR